MTEFSISFFFKKSTLISEPKGRCIADLYPAIPGKALTCHVFYPDNIVPQHRPLTDTTLSPIISSTPIFEENTKHIKNAYNPVFRAVLDHRNSTPIHCIHHHSYVITPHSPPTITKTVHELNIASDRTNKIATITSSDNVLSRPRTYVPILLILQPISAPSRNLYSANLYLNITNNHLSLIWCSCVIFSATHRNTNKMIMYCMYYNTFDALVRLSHHIICANQGGGNTIPGSPTPASFLITFIANGPPHPSLPTLARPLSLCALIRCATTRNAFTTDTGTRAPIIAVHSCTIPYSTRLGSTCYEEEEHKEKSTTFAAGHRSEGAIR